MNRSLKARLARLQKTHDDDGYDLPGGDSAAADNEDFTGKDFGDDFVPTDDDAEPAAKTPKKAEKSPKRAPKEEVDADADADADADTDTDAGPDTDPAAEADDKSLRGGGEGDDEKATHTGTPKTKKGVIPVARHETILRKERERRERAEAQLSQSRTQQQVAQTNEDLSKAEDELVKMEEEYNELLAEGDTKGAAAKMTAIRRKNAEIQRVTAQQRDQEVMARAVEKMRYDEALERIEAEYPELDENSDEYDEDVYEDVADKFLANVGRGMSRTKALQHAVARVMKPETAGQRRATEVTPRVSERDVGDERRSAAVKRNLDAAKRTPPATGRAGVGNDAAGGEITAKKVMEMTDEEFDKLDEKTLAKMRGDVM